MTRASILLAALGVLSASPLPGQSKLPLEQYTVPNGLRVFLVEDHSTPLVTVDLWYHVGSRNEEPGRSGFARLFERLMFRGSQHVASGQHYQLVEAAGGEVTAHTSEDRTAFSETLPSNQLALGLWLEADRMRSLTITEAGFSAERESTKQERQMRVDTQPYGAAFLDGMTVPFDTATCFPYSHSVMGSLDDLDAAQLEEVQAFFKLHYVPNNATLVVTGDFEPAEAKRLIQDYFADIPRGPPPPETRCDVNYAAGERTRQWSDPLASLPAVIVTYRVPPHSDPESRALQLLALIAGQGETSRLNRSLMRDQRVAVQTGSGMESRGGPGLLYLYAIAQEGMGAEAVRSSLVAQVARLGSDVTQVELDKVKNQYRATTLAGRQTTYQMAEDVEHVAHFHSSTDEIHTDIDRYRAVTLEDLRRAANQYLIPANSSTLIVAPMGSTTPQGEHQQEEKE